MNEFGPTDPSEVMDTTDDNGQGIEDMTINVTNLESQRIPKLIASSLLLAVKNQFAQSDEGVSTLKFNPNAGARKEGETAGWSSLFCQNIQGLIEAEDPSIPVEIESSPNSLSCNMLFRKNK